MEQFTQPDAPVKTFKTFPSINVQYIEQVTVIDFPPERIHVIGCKSSICFFMYSYISIVFSFVSFLYSRIIGVQNRIDWGVLLHQYIDSSGELRRNGFKVVAIRLASVLPTDVSALEKDWLYIECPVEPSNPHDKTNFAVENCNDFFKKVCFNHFSLKLNKSSYFMFN